MIQLLGRFMQLFRRSVRVIPDGKGYRVGGEWCNSQTEVRQHLESLGHAESEIVRILRELNIEKYGDPHR